MANPNRVSWNNRASVTTRVLQRGILTLPSGPSRWCQAKNMHRCVCAVFVVVTVVTSNTHTQASAASPSLLATTYTINYTHDSTQALLRVAAPSSASSLHLTLQTDLTNCISKVMGNYTGHALQITGSYTSDASAVMVFGDRRVGGVAPHHELLSVTWRPLEEEKKLVVEMAKSTLTLATGYDGEAGGRWWRLWTRDGEEQEEAFSGDSLPPQPNQAGAEPGRGVLMRTYFAHSIWGLSVDKLLPDERRRLLNLTFAYHEEQWQMSLQVPVLAVAFELESKIWKSQGRQHYQAAGEVRSTKSGASLKFTHLEQNKKTHITDDKGEADGSCDVEQCEDSGVKELQKSQHYVTGGCIPDSEKPRKMALNDACSGQDHKPNYDMKEWPKNEKDESVLNDVTQEIRQKITSRMLSFSSNMTTIVSPDGGRSIRILQRSHLAFCPRLGWTLNQIFRFRRDWSGWEYVVSAWEWGDMVVRGEWGVSLLQWYQKTFTFSLDQAAVLPSTQLVLDFRDWRSFKIWVKWPALASSLAASLTLGDERHTLLVEEVDEFVGEDAAEVVVRVVARHTPAGLVLNCFANTSKVQELHAFAAAILAQAMTNPDVCGEVPDYNTVERFLHDLLGQSPSSLWADLLQESHRMLLGSGFSANLHYLREVFEEEMGTGEPSGLWELAWTVLERAGLLRSHEEELEVLVPSEWMRLAQSWWAGVVKGGGGGCEGGTLLVSLLEVVAGTLRRGGH